MTLPLRILFDLNELDVGIPLIKNKAIKKNSRTSSSLLATSLAVILILNIAQAIQIYF